MASRFEILFALPLALLLQAQGGPPPAAADRGLSHGTILFGEPVATDLVRPRAVPVQVGAVVAEQRVEIMGARMALDRPVTIGAPFNYELSGDSAQVRKYRTAAGDRWCWSGIPGIRFTPPRDEAGRIFPGICLLDSDGDGAFEAVRMLAYPPSTATRDVAIAPVRLRAAPPADPRMSRRHVFRRLRIASVSASDIVLILEYAQLATGRTAPDYGEDPPSEWVALARQAGASASIAGLILSVERGSAGERIAVVGAFARWAMLEQDGAAVRLGPYFLAPRED